MRNGPHVSGLSGKVGVAPLWRRLQVELIIHIYIYIFTFSHLEFEVLVGQGSAV